MVTLSTSFEEDLNAAAAYHGHVCVGQYIGIRMARYACAALNIAQPRQCRDLFVFVEIDRCLSDAVSVVTGCKIGKRRFKHIDYGKSAATFVNNATGDAVRIASKGWIRTSAADLDAFFRAISDEELFSIERVKIEIPPENLPGPPIEKTQCTQCGEYITDKRQVVKDGRPFCKACANGAYYTLIA